MIEWFHGFGILQWTGLVAGIIYVIFAAKGKWWCWPTGLIWVICTFIISIDGKLYSDAILQVLYFGLTLFGWYNWITNNGRKSPEKPIATTSQLEWFYSFVFLVIFTIIQAKVLTQFTDTDVPYIDSLTTSMSLLATWLLAKKKIENWWIWIVVNPVYIWLYHYKNYELYSWLAVFFTIMALVGLTQWKKILRSQNVHN